MLISEIFYSLQGEGRLTGVPSVFIRTSGCNLRCKWCDTPYASWHPEGEKMSVAQILENIAPHPARHVVLTGGEPMVAPGIHELAAALHAANYHITIETSGTIPPAGIACDLASVSPKLSNSTPSPEEIDAVWIERHERARNRPDLLREWMSQGPYQLKFVYSAPDDLDEIQALVAATGVAVPPSSILLMPEGTSDEALAARQRELVGICLATGHCYCDRLHIRLFGNTKGT
jgi:7-carboxy-7-deazaguanine synthase